MTSQKCRRHNRVGCPTCLAEARRADDTDTAMMSLFILTALSDDDMSTHHSSDSGSTYDHSSGYDFSSSDSSSYDSSSSDSGSSDGGGGGGGGE